MICKTIISLSTIMFLIYREISDSSETPEHLSFFLLFYLGETMAYYNPRLS
jgi:hypothetical protein